MSRRVIRRWDGIWDAMAPQVPRPASVPARGVLHTLPFLIPQYRAAVLLALAAMAFELLTLAWIRRRLFGTGFVRSFISVTLGGAIIAAISAAPGAVS